jgi:hypothetical protein
LHNQSPAEIHLEILYTLNSEDQAILAVYLEEMKDSDNVGATPAEACKKPSHRTVNAVSLPVVRGDHFISATIKWPGSAGTGFLAAGANLWKNVDGRPGYLIKAFGLFPIVCYPFGP